MNIKIQVDNMRDAEKLSYICNGFPFEMFLRANKFCADPKSTLGILAMMYTDKNNLIIDTGDMPDEQQKNFVKKIADFVRPVAE
ncbi:MAG: hypothetical protein RSJ41_10905 [Clostridia bacterium]